MPHLQDYLLDTLQYYIYCPLHVPTVRETIIGTYATDQAARGQRLTRRTAILQSEAASTEIQPSLPDSVAKQLPIYSVVVGSISIPEKHNGQLGATVEQYIGVETRLLGQPAGTSEQRAPRRPRPPGLLDLGLGELENGKMGSWGQRRGLLKQAAACSCQRLHNCNCDLF